jgi:integrase
VNGYKRCKCRDTSGRELGTSCPRLKRRDGSWNPAHGTWYGKAEFTPGRDGQRVTLRTGGFPTQEAMSAWFDGAWVLMGIPEPGPDGHKARMQILDLIRESRRLRAELPDPDDLRRRYAEGAAFRPGTTGSYLLAWIEKHRTAADLAPTTLHGYERTVRRLLLPVIGEVPLDKLRPGHVLDVVAAIDLENERVLSARASGDPAVRKSVAGRRIARPSSKRRYVAVLSSALAEAMSPQSKLITTNVAAGIRVGRGGRRASIVRAVLWSDAREKAWRDGYESRLEASGRKPGATARFAFWRTTSARPGPVMVWTPAHLGRFLDHAAEHDPRLYATFCVIAHCGLRRGEACGLPWAEVDFGAAAVTVSTQITQVGWEPVTGPPKTAASLATVRMDLEVTVPALRAWRAEQLRERVAYGQGWTDTGLVLSHPDGRAYHPAQLTGRFERVAYAAGLPPIRLHDLRHCAATLALAAGADITAVSRMMRHASVQITADIYAEVLPELAAQVSAKVVQMIPRATRKAAQ